jgi:hypothetical protein
MESFAMGRNYSIDGSQAVASPTDTALGLTSATTIRPQIYDVIFGSSATPADNALNWLLQRYTAAGTSTAVTPEPLDPDDPAALAAGGENHTAEPTYTANAILLNISANQRSTQRWVSAPGGELKMPATAANGAGLQPVHSSFTGTVEATIHFEE